MYQLTVRLDPNGTQQPGIRYSNGSGNLMITGYKNVIEDIRFVRDPSQQGLWEFTEFIYMVKAGPDTIGNEPVIKLISVVQDEIKLEDRLGEYGRYKYTIKIKTIKDGTEYTSDPELQNIREIGPNP